MNKLTHNRDAVTPILQQRDFVNRSGTFRAEHHTAAEGTPLGDLGPFGTTSLLESLDTGEPVYIIYSYDTPIAWHTTTLGWFFNRDHRTITTARHQGIVFRTVTN